MTDARNCRAPLFVPADRPDRIARAVASGADALILDLEDAVAPGAKEAARDGLRQSLAQVPPGLAVIIRVNAVGTGWYAGDMQAIRRLRPAAVMLPKASDPETVSAALGAAGGAPLLALVECARGLASARRIAALPGLARLAFGSVDFCADFGCRHLRELLLPARFELVLASRLAGIAAPLDGVTTDLSSEQAAAGDASHAESLGMGGKLCIHPKQIAPVLAAFRPDPARIDWARRVLASGEGAALVDGEMVDAPVRLRARAILAAAGDDPLPKRPAEA